MIVFVRCFRSALLPHPIVMALFSHFV
uniref:Uncharacterized protein n=1 Tax=Anguilla anguilla TaxID=7936 RepID=A0A0E9P8B7_ANGAN